MAAKKYLNSWVLTSIVILLIGVTLFQSIQLINMQSQIDSVVESLQEYKPSRTVLSSGSSSTSLLQQNLQNLPSMVGGC